jgi:hypothetical protein
MPRLAEPRSFLVLDQGPIGNRLSLSLVSLQFAPGAQVSRTVATLTVGIIAGLLAYVEAVTAVLRTPNSRSEAALPLTTDYAQR